MANTRQPPNVIRGIRSPIPPGYVLGRSDHGSGDPHLIKIGDGLVVKDRTLIAKAGNSGAAGDLNGFGFSMTGLFLNKELLGTGVFGRNITFPSTVAANVPALKVTLAAATADATLTIVPVLAGVDQAAVADILFPAGLFTGSITWTPTTPYTLLADLPFKLYAPATADATLSGITGMVPGDVA